MDLQGLAFWSFGASEVSDGAFGYCKCLFVFCFYLNVCLMQEHIIIVSFNCFNY